MLQNKELKWPLSPHDQKKCNHLNDLLTRNVVLIFFSSKFWRVNGSFTFWCKYNVFLSITGLCTGKPSNDNCMFCFTTLLSHYLLKGIGTTLQFTKKGSTTRPICWTVAGQCRTYRYHYGFRHVFFIPGHSSQHVIQMECLFFADKNVSLCSVSY